MRGAQGDADGRSQSRGMLGQRGIGVGQHEGAQLLVVSGRQLRGPPRAWLLGQRLTAALAGPPAKDRSSIDAKETSRFTWGQPGVQGCHQALAEVGRRARSHTPSCHRGMSCARCSKG